MKKLLFSIVAFACGARQPTYVVGGLYSVPAERGRFSIVKILRVDPEGVHLRMYSNTFDRRPTDIDEKTLYMVGVDHKFDEVLGMGHAPISKKSFSTWGAGFIKAVPVREDELEGYKIWLDAKGGYF
jgi:hypothetical protein